MELLELDGDGAEDVVDDADDVADEELASELVDLAIGYSLGLVRVAVLYVIDGRDVNACVFVWTMCSR